MKNVAIYARVSSEKQEREKTIESQLEELRHVCKQSDTIIGNEYIDNGCSGSTLVRPALDKLRDDASKGLFDAIYIHSPERLARKYLYQALVLEELLKKGVELIFLNKPVTDNPEDQLLLGMQGLIAEYERAKIAIRTRRGRFHKARTGNIMGGFGPYGYDYVKKTTEKGAYYKINPEEAKIVKLIYSLYLECKSTPGIVKTLIDMKIRARGGAPIWSRALIHRILRSSCYIGTAYYNKYNRSGKAWKVRDKEEWIPIPIPSIIDKETYELVQEILNNHNGGRRTKYYLLSSLVKCKDCGSRYVALKNRYHYYYRCGNYTKRYPLPRNCYAKAVRGEKLENAVMHAVQKAILHPDILIQHVLSFVDNCDDNVNELKKVRDGLLNKKNKMEHRKKKALDLYLDGHISKDVFIKRQEEFETFNKEIEGDLANIEYKMSHKLDKSLIIRNIESFCILAKERIKKLSPEKAHEFLRYLTDQIIFDSQNRTVHITGHIPIMKSDPDGRIFSTNLPFENPAPEKELVVSFPSRLYGRDLKQLYGPLNKKLRFELEVKV